MSLTQCQSCIYKEQIIRQEIRKANYRLSRLLPTTKQQATIADLKRQIAECDHECVENSRQAARDRHARERALAIKDNNR